VKNDGELLTVELIVQFPMFCLKNGYLMTVIISVGFSCDFTHCSMCNRLTFLAENKFLNWFSVVSCAHRTFCPLSRCLASFPLSCGTECVIILARRSPSFVGKLSSESFFCLSVLIKILSSVESTIIFIIFVYKISSSCKVLTGRIKQLLQCWKLRFSVTKIWQ